MGLRCKHDRCDIKAPEMQLCGCEETSWNEDSRHTRCGIKAPEVELAGESGKVGPRRRGVRQEMETRSSIA